MAIDTSQLTVSARDIMAMPLRQRQEAASRGLLDIFATQMLPGQIASAFPSYVKDFTTGGTQVANLGSATQYTPRGSSARVTSKQSPVIPKPEITGGRYQGGPQGGSQETTGYGPADQTQIPVIKDIGNGTKLSKQQRIAIVKKTQVQELIRSGYSPDVANKMAAAFGGNAYAESELNPTVPHDNGTGYGLYGARLERKDKMLAWLKDNGYEQDSLVGQSRYMVIEAQKDFPDMMKKLAGMENVSDMTTEVMNTFERPGVPRLSARQNGAIEFNSTNTDDVELDGNVTQQIESFFDKTEPEQTALTDQAKKEEETATPVLGNATFYDEILATYPDKIDVNSDVWDKLDPSLAAYKDQIVSAKTGEVNLATVLAADASAKVLRKHGYEPRPVSGGDLHSGNHGANRDANYAIDMAASVIDEAGNKTNVQGGSLPKQVRFEMIGAAKLATTNADQNFRAGLPVEGDYRSVHLQSDDTRQSALWSYVPGMGGDVDITDTRTGNELISYLKNLDNLPSEEKVRYLSETTGLKIKKDEPPTASVEAAPQSTAPQAANVATESQPLAETQTAAPVKTQLSISDLTGTTLTPKQSTSANTAMVAAAGGAEIEKPYIAQPVDGAGPDILMGETGPEKIVPRHRADDFGIQSYQIQQMGQAEPAKTDVVGAENRQQPQYLPKPTFAPEPKQTPILAEHTPIPASLRKQYADSKMENRLDNLSPIGSVYSNFGFA